MTLQVCILYPREANLGSYIEYHRKYIFLAEVNFYLDIQIVIHDNPNVEFCISRPKHSTIPTAQLQSDLHVVPDISEV